MQDKNMDKRIKKDAEYALEGLLVDPGIITGKIGECKLEVGKRALEIFYKFETQPETITFGDLQDLVESKGSQIGFKGDYLNHITTTAGVLRSLMKKIKTIHPDLPLPGLGEAYAMGLMHDLNVTFSDYAKGGQQSKEFDEFLLAKMFGWERMRRIAMHSDYLGVIRLMSQGADFPKKEAYGNMKEILQGEGPLSYESIEKEFRGVIEGKENLPLILLVVADYISNNKPVFNPETLEEDFQERSKDIVWRYHGKALTEGKTPSLLGQALVSGGLERITMYKNLVKTLLNKEPGYEVIKANFMGHKK